MKHLSVYKIRSSHCAAADDLIRAVCTDCDLALLTQLLITLLCILIIKVC